MARYYYPQARAVLQLTFDTFRFDPVDAGPTFSFQLGRLVPDPDVIATVAVIPKSVTVHRTGYFEPDSWQLVFDAKSLPIDPAMLRGGFAEIFLFATNRLLGQDQLIDKKTEDGIGLNRDTSEEANSRFLLGNDPMVSGLFDDASIEFSSSGKWLTISGQDMTAYLASKQWTPNNDGSPRRIPVGTRLDIWLADILAEAESQRRLTVVSELDTSKLPIIGQGELNQHGRGIPIQQETNYWQIMYGVVQRYGYICFVRGNNVVLTHPKTLDDVRTSKRKILAWGKNLESLEMTRHLGIEKPPRVIARAYDEKLREIVTVEFPNGSLDKQTKDFNAQNHFKKKTTSVQKLNPDTKIRRGNTQKTTQLEDKYIFINTQVSDRDVMLRAAHTTYILMGKPERSIVAVTRDLTDLEDESLMDLTAGDAVDVEWLDFNQEALASERWNEGSRARFLKARGYSDQVAQAIAQHYTQLLGIKRPFRVRSATYQYDAETGIRIEVELMDFVVVDGARDADTAAQLGGKPGERVKKADGTPLGAGALAGRRRQ